MASSFLNTHYNVIDTLKHYDADKWYLAQRIVAMSDNKNHENMNVISLSQKMKDNLINDIPLQVCSVFIECALWTYNHGKYAWSL